MKTKINSRVWGSLVAFSLLLGVSFGVISCKDEIDASNLVTKTEPTVWDYLDSVDVYSDFTDILQIVRTGEGENTSSLSSLLASYGNYTCFAPNNEAIRKYVLQQTDSTTSDWHQLLKTDSLAVVVIAYNCIIDNGDETAYALGDFPTNGGTFALPNLNNRALSCQLLDNGNYQINGAAVVDRPDVRLGNGYVQGVDAVISLSTKSVADLIIDAPNMKIMSYLMQQTGWADSLVRPRNDDSYSTDGYPESAKVQSNTPAIEIIQHRYLGFTGFVETDDVYADAIGVSPVVDETTGELTNGAQILTALNTYMQQQGSPYGTSAEGDLTNPDNPVNRFVAYHFLRGSLPYSDMVLHFNEFGYSYGDLTNPQTQTLTIDVWDYYQTMGKYSRLMKITRDVEDPEIPLYINRKQPYQNGRNDNYKHDGEATVRGAKISAENRYTSPETGETVSVPNNAENGYYYPIDEILMYTNTVSHNVLNERIRFDLATVMPELWSADGKGRAHSNYYFTNDFFDNLINITDETNLFYIRDGFSGASSSPNGQAWKDLHGDEVLLSGVYDITIKLPPVPYDGNYEIRMSQSNNPLRGMAQIYFGENPQQMTPVGLPVDMRIGQYGGTSKPADDVYMSIPWEPDVADDETNLQVERNLRNKGYMKGPKYFGWTPSSPVRNHSASLRRIIYTSIPMQADKTYYIRIKSALDDSTAQFPLDYFEFVPTIMVDQGTEDIW